MGILKKLDNAANRRIERATGTPPAKDEVAQKRAEKAKGKK